MVGLFVIVCVATPIAALVLTYLLFFEDGAKNTGRWGVRHEKRTVGASPYRAGQSTEALPQGAPIWVRFVCWLSAMGGVVTTAFLAPAGIILVIVLMHSGSVLVCLPAFLVSVSGFVAGVFLVRVARQVTKHEPVQRFAFHYLYVHHACVAGTMLLVDAGHGNFHLSQSSILICLAMTIPLMVLHSVAKVPPGLKSG